jgi:hypothetical protein
VAQPGQLWLNQVTVYGIGDTQSGGFRHLKSPQSTSGLKPVSPSVSPRTLKSLAPDGTRGRVGRQVRTVRAVDGDDGVAVWQLGPEKRPQRYVRIPSYANGRCGASQSREQPIVTWVAGAASRGCQRGESVAFAARAVAGVRIRCRCPRCCIERFHA